MSTESTAIYRYERGRVTHLPAPHWVDHDTLLEPGRVQPAALAMLPAAYAAVERIAPQTVAYFTPRLLCSTESMNGTEEYSGQLVAIEGRHFERWGGLHRRRYIVVTYASAVGLLATTHHELFHRIERQLPAPTLALLRGAVRGRGRDYPPGYGDLDEERLARLFESFAEFLEEGGQTMWVNELDPDRSVPEALYWIFTGGFARWRAAQAAAQAAEAAKRARRARRWAAVRQLIGV